MTSYIIPHAFASSVTWFEPGFQIKIRTPEKMEGEEKEKERTKKKSFR